jgi:hypothetical protein
MDDSRIPHELHRARQLSAPPEPAYERLLRRRDRRRRNARIASALTALLVGGAAVIGTTVVFGLHGTGKRTPHIPVTQPPPQNLVAGPGQYYYTRTQIYFGDTSESTTYRLAGPWTLTEWFGPNRSGRATFDGYKGASSVGYSWPGGRDSTYAAGEFPLEDLSDLSSDPDRLLDELTARSMPGGASPNPIPTTSPGRTSELSALLRTLQDLFNGDEQFTPPSVRAAMFDVARGLQGVTTIERTADPVGREAIALRWVVEYQGPPSYVEWFFSPSTKQLMAETWTQGGRVLEARIVMEAGIAESTQEPPGPDQSFFPPAEVGPSFAKRG